MHSCRRLESSMITCVHVTVSPADGWGVNREHFK
jgi:hypothetical protein